MVVVVVGNVVVRQWFACLFVIESLHLVVIDVLYSLSDFLDFICLVYFVRFVA